MATMCSSSSTTSTEAAAGSDSLTKLDANYGTLSAASATRSTRCRRSVTPDRTGDVPPEAEDAADGVAQLRRRLRLEHVAVRTQLMRPAHPRLVGPGQD